MMIAAFLERDSLFGPGLATRSKRFYPRRQNFGGAEGLDQTLERAAMEKVRIGIVGYGNIGWAVELSLRQNPDMTPAVVLTRRDPTGDQDPDLTPEL